MWHALCQPEMVGGMLTNFKTISQRIEALRRLNEMEEDGSLKYYLEGSYQITFRKRQT